MSVSWAAICYGSTTVVLPALVLQQHYFFTVNRVPYPVRIINPQLPRRKRLKYYPLRIAESGDEGAELTTDSDSIYSTV